MNLLSVDWDYFFPPFEPYDWGANEDNLIFKEIIWTIRKKDKNILTGANAVDEYKPDLLGARNFWNFILLNSDPARVVIEDEHKAVWPYAGGCDMVLNFDQHADFGYCGKPLETVNSGNWAAFLEEEKYNLVYPLWRRHRPESLAETPPNISYGLPVDPPKFDIVFFCRSSCWTPPWADNEFSDMAKELMVKAGAWASHDINDYVMFERNY